MAPSKESKGIVSPLILLASSPDNSNVLMHRVTSLRACIIVFPASLTINRANSSSSSRTMAAVANRILARW